MEVVDIVVVVVGGKAAVVVVVVVVGVIVHPSFFDRGKTVGDRHGWMGGELG